ncbi:MAG: hypothetical protein ACR2QW_04065 [bacterium]
MNHYYEQYRMDLQQQWQGMSFVSKCTAFLICTLLLVSGLLTGFFVFSVSLIIAMLLYIKTVIEEKLPKADP